MYPLVNEVPPYVSPEREYYRLWPLANKVPLLSFPLLPTRGGTFSLCTREENMPFADEKIALLAINSLSGRELGCVGLSGIYPHDLRCTA